jgi:hypothetical protein
MQCPRQSPTATACRCDDRRVCERGCDSHSCCSSSALVSCWHPRHPQPWRACAAEAAAVQPGGHAQHGRYITGWRCAHFRSVFAKQQRLCGA